MCAQITEISTVSPTQTAGTKRMDFIENFESELEGAKNAQSIAGIIDGAFKPKCNDFMDLDPYGKFELWFSYKDSVLGYASDIMPEVTSSSSYAGAILEQNL